VSVVAGVLWVLAGIVAGFVGGRVWASRPRQDRLDDLGEIGVAPRRVRALVRRHRRAVRDVVGVRRDIVELQAEAAALLGDIDVIEQRLVGREPVGLSPSVVAAEETGVVVALRPHAGDAHPLEFFAAAPEALLLVVSERTVETLLSVRDRLGPQATLLAVASESRLSGRDLRRLGAAFVFAGVRCDDVRRRDVRAHRAALRRTRRAEARKLARKEKQKRADVAAAAREAKRGPAIQRKEARVEVRDARRATLNEAEAAVQAERETAKQNKQAERETAKQARVDAKAAAKAERETAKQNKQAERETAKQARVDAKAAAKAERETAKQNKQAEREADKQARVDAKAAAKAERETAKQNKQAERETKQPASTPKPQRRQNGKQQSRTRQKQH
jgi:hypothetical protein